MALTVSVSAQAVISHAPVAKATQENALDDLDPRAENIDEILSEMDRQYTLETGLPAFVAPKFSEAPKCRKFDCPLYAIVDKSTQTLKLYVRGSLEYTWLVSTGVAGYGTPNWEGQPNGRIYQAYSSKKFPGGDYKGLGNMPYAVFLFGGFAIHGTTVGNFAKLGKPASHGCIRLHAENGKIFNQLVRQFGVQNTWVSITN